MQRSRLSSQSGRGSTDVSTLRQCRSDGQDEEEDGEGEIAKINVCVLVYFRKIAAADAAGRCDDK